MTEAAETWELKQLLLAMESAVMDRSQGVGSCYTGDLCPLRAFAMEAVASEQAANWTTGFSLELSQKKYIY